MKNKIQQLISDGKFESAFLMLPKTQNFVLLQGRFKRNKADNMKGIISRSDFEMENNRILYAILDLVDELDNGNFTSAPEIVEEIKTNHLTQNTSNQINNMTHFDAAKTLLVQVEKIQTSPANRIPVSQLLFDVRAYNSKLQDEDLAGFIEELAVLSVKPYASQGFNNTQFRTTYDDIVNRLVLSLNDLLVTIDSFSNANQSSVEALSVLQTTRNMANVKLWVEALLREAGTDFAKTDRLHKAYELWRKFCSPLSGRNLALAISTQVIPDIQRLA